ncbi:MAG: Ig-like domain-containing protein [Saprospiraceae bacterium]|nr:Ig-like domain-containing protein [Saprospiraceae bacterium]
MSILKHSYFILFSFLVFFSCRKEDKPLPAFRLLEYTINGTTDSPARGVDVTPVISISFNESVLTTTLQNGISLTGLNQNVPLTFETENNDSTIVIRASKTLNYLTNYSFVINTILKAKNGQDFESAFNSTFTTGIDSSLKFDLLSKESLLDSIQKKTFRYFWEFGHPVSGLIRERNTSGELVTSGGSGFGIMSILVGIHRNFITRQQGLERITTITDFLLTKADRFHGAFPHWLHGSTGKTIPFSTRDNGGDLVETSYLVAGLLSASEFFDQNTDKEKDLRTKIKLIWEGVEWNWYTKNNENVLYWHWSPDYNWQMNLQIQGYNEALITYILAASSPTFPISKAVYDEGWAKKGAIKNGRSYYGLTLPLGYDFGGPLFFSHYSFLGIDPRNLKDLYGNYWQQGVQHSLINHAHCAVNPRKFFGYSDECWGLTASDTNNGYAAHSPTNDLGVISPTAALSSMPYTPEQSMKALEYFYYILGDKIYREYGFVDAFNLHNLWFASSFLAIDQGPIIIMIENHRSGLLWNYTMKNTDVQHGLNKLGFTY